MTTPRTDKQENKVASPSPMTGWQLLKTRDFGLLFWGQMTSQIGDSLNRVALLWFVYQMTGSAMKMVMIGLLQTIPPLILGPLVGVCLLYTSDAADERSSV